MYEELPPAADVREVIACLWRRDPEPGGEAVRIVPDGCVDIVHESGGPLLVAGPDTRPWQSAPREGVAGVRLRIGAAAGVLGVPAVELRDQRVPLTVLWDDDGLEERLAGAASEDRPSLLQAAVRARQAEPDPLVAAAVERLQSAGVGATADALGVSERQLRRRFVDAVGYGPKMLHRVLRLRAFAARAGRADLAWLAADLGFADQAHLTRECRALAGVTPAVLAKGVPAAPGAPRRRR